MGLHEYKAEHAFKIGHAHGSSFLTQKCIAFSAKSFGRQRKLLVPYDAIESVAPSESSDARLKLVTKTRKRLKFRLESAEETKQAVQLLSGLVAGKSQHDTSTIKGKVEALRDDVRAEYDKARVELKTEVSKAKAEVKKKAKRSSSFMGGMIGLSSPQGLPASDDFELENDESESTTEG